jgi:hypothetical protein
MHRVLVALALAAALLASGCSVATATDNVGTFDGPARQACADAQALAQALSFGTVPPSDLRARASRIYQEAEASSNPILTARAVTLYADATSAAVGGQGVHVRADLQALAHMCEGANG